MNSSVIFFYLQFSKHYYAYIENHKKAVGRCLYQPGKSLEYAALLKYSTIYYAFIIKNNYIYIYQYYSIGN